MPNIDDDDVAKVKAKQRLKFWQYRHFVLPDLPLPLFDQMPYDRDDLQRDWGIDFDLGYARSKHVIGD